MKKQLVVLSAAAMVAAAAVPALAFENEFHGMYRLKGLVTNFQAAGLGATNQPPLLTEKSNGRDYTLFEQRARLQYIAKASDDLKLVTHFEMDSTWGDAGYANGRGLGGGIAADTVNLETKNVYLDFNIPSAPLNVKLGIQGFTDAYKGVFMMDDAGGAVVTGKFGPATATAAFFRTYDKGSARDFAATTTWSAYVGKQVVDLYVADVKAALGKVATVGASYYGANNTSNFSAGQFTHTFGVNAAAKLGMVDLDAFVLYQGGKELYAFYGTGVNKNAYNLDAYAAQVAAKLNLGPVAVRASGLYASGDNKDYQANSTRTTSTAFQNIAASGATAGAAAGGSVSSGVYYPSNMLLIMRSIWAMDSDQALVSSTNNSNQGLVAAFAGADATITDKFNVSANVGHVMVDKKTETSATAAGSKTNGRTIGTEVNASLNYKLYPNLTATLQGAYVVLGDYQKVKVSRSTIMGESVTNPYLAGIMMNYTF